MLIFPLIIVSFQQQSPKSDSGIEDAASPSPSPNPSPNASPHGVKRPHNDDDSEEETNDEVRLWEDGFKDRYYESKFDVAPDNFKFRNEVAAQYVTGLCWVLRYYYQVIIPSNHKNIYDILVHLNIYIF